MPETNFIFSVPDVITQLSWFVFMAIFAGAAYCFILMFKHN
jgi:hypothetical protein